MPLYEDGEKINYNKDDYNPVTQRNEPLKADLLAAKEKAATKVPDWVDKGTIVTSDLDPKKNAITLSGYGNRGIGPGDLDEDYDMYGAFGSWDEIKANRIALQSDWAKGSRAVFGGLMKGIGTAFKDVGFMLDWRSYAKVGGLMNMEETGAINDILNNVGDWIHESVDEYAPIYEKNDTKSIVGQLMKWGTVSSILDSAVGFALPGGVASKAGTYAMKGVALSGKLLKWTNRLTNLSRSDAVALRLMRAEKAFINLQKAAPKASNIINTVGPMTMQGIGEGMWEATDSYKEHLESVSDLVLTGELSLQDATNQANDIAENVLQLNMAKSFLNLHIFNSVARKFGKGLIRSKPTFGKKLQSMVKEMPLEAIEEGGQEIFKKESEFRAMREYEKTHKNSPVLEELRKKGKYSGNLPNDFFERMANLTSTNQVLLAGIIGAVSGPIQHALMRGVGSKKRFKDQVDAYEKQQAFIKKRQGVLDDSDEFKKFIEQVNKDNKKTGGATFKKVKAEQDLAKTVDKTALTNKLIELADNMDNDDLRELVKKQAYTALIQEHVAAGTYEYLEKEAAKYSGTNHHMSELAGYMKRLKPVINKSRGYLNEGNIFNTAMGIELSKDLKKAYTGMLEEIQTDKLDKTTETLEEHDHQIQLINTIKKIDENIQTEQEYLKSITSMKHQHLLSRELIYDNEKKKALESLVNVKTKSQLNRIIRAYPELRGTKEYTNQVRNIESGKVTKAPKKKITAATKSVEQHEKETTQTVEENIPGTKEGLTQHDENQGRVINEEGKKVNKAGVPILAIENIEAHVTGAVTDVSDKISPEEVNDITKIVHRKYEREADTFTSPEEQVTFVENLVNDIVQGYVEGERTDIQEEQEEVNQEVQRLERRTELFGSTDTTQKLPEELFEEHIAHLQEVKVFNDEVDKLKKKTTLTEEEDAFLMQVPENADATSKELIAEVRAIAEAIGHEKPDGFVNFKDYVEYLKAILGEDFVNDNFIEAKLVYRTLTDHKGELPGVYNDVSDNVTDYGLPEDMPTPEKNAVVFGSKSPAGTTFEDVVVEMYKAEKTAKKSYNRDPSESIAHKSESSHIEIDAETKEAFLEEDTKAVKDLAVFLNPYKYNSREEIAFEIDRDYNLGAQASYIFNEDGSIKEDGPEFQEYVRENGFPGDTIPEDFVPIKIIGPAGEDFKWVHKPEWAETLAGQDTQAQREKIRAKRLSILSQIKKSEKGQAVGNLEGKIMYWDDKNSTYRGFVMNEVKSPIPTSEAIRDNINIGIKKSGGLINSKVKESQIMNLNYIKNLPTGVSYVLLPITKVDGVMQYHAEPLRTTKLNEKLGRTAHALIQAYLTQDKKGELAKEYKNKRNLDITTPTGLEKALETFMYVYKPKTDIEAHSRYARNKHGGIGLLSINKETGVISFGIQGRELVAPVSEEVSDVSDKNITGSLKLLDGYFKTGKFMFNIDKTRMNGNKAFYHITVGEEGKVSTTTVLYNDLVKDNTETTVVGQRLADGSYTYTLQNIVTFSVKDSKEESSRILEDENPIAAEWDAIEKKEITIKYTNGKPVLDGTAFNVFQRKIHENIDKDSDSILQILKSEGMMVSKNEVPVLKSYIAMLRKNKIEPMRFDEFATNRETIEKTRSKKHSEAYKENLKKAQAKSKEDIEKRSVQKVLTGLGITDITTEMTEDEIAETTGSAKEAKVIKELIDAKDTVGLNNNIPHMRFYKERNPIAETAWYKELSEDDKEDASELYKLNENTSNKIATLAKEGLIEEQATNAYSEGFTTIQELQKKCE